MTIIHTNNKTNYTINNLINNVTYNVRVAAINSVGQGPFTTWVSGTPIPSPDDPYYYNDVLLMHFDDNRTGVYDPYSDNVTLLLHMDGSFVDSSNNSVLVTDVNSSDISSSVKKFGTGSYDTTNNVCKLPPDIMQFGDTFTIECYAYPTQFSNSTCILWQNFTNTGGMGGHIVAANADGQLSVYERERYVVSPSSATQLTLNQWHHIVLSCNSNNVALYINGQLVGTGGFVPNRGASGSDRAYIGGSIYGGKGGVYIDEFRITKGISRYAYNFTPLIEPFPAILPLFVDSSGYHRAIKPYGNATINSSQNKFGGYSGYFDGNSYLFAAQDSGFAFGTGPFTIELWAYAFQWGGYFLDFRGTGGGKFAFLTSPDGKFYPYFGNTDTGGSGTSIPSNEWVHIAISFDGTICRCYANGVLCRSDNFSPENQTSCGAYIGQRYTSDNRFIGYIDELRITKGIARYTSDFSVPTNPFSDNSTASTEPSAPQNLLVNENNNIISLAWSKPNIPLDIDTRAPITGYSIEYSNDNQNTWTTSNISTDSDYAKVVLSLPMNGENNSTIFNDYSVYNKILSVNGDTKITNNQSKFGNSSAYFDGSGDYLTINGNDTSLDLTNQDWTIECWIRPNGDWSRYNSFISKRGNGGSEGTDGDWQIYFKVNTGVLSFYPGGPTGYESSVAPTPNIWNHVAAVRYNNIITLYLNGVSVLNINSDTRYNTNRSLFIGGWPAGGEYFSGYINDIRITKGLARYKNNFDSSILPQTPTNSINLVPNNTYAFRVRAQNRIGFGPYSNIANISTISNPPSGINIVPDDSQVFMSWFSPLPNNSAIRDYSIQYSSDSGSSWTTYDHSSTTETLANITGLINGSNYIFKIAAVNFAGIGSYSDNSSSITVAPRSDSLYNKTRLLLHLDSN